MKPVEKLNQFLKKEGLTLTAQPIMVPTKNRESFIVQVRVLVGKINKPKTKNEKNTIQDKS